MLAAPTGGARAAADPSAFEAAEVFEEALRLTAPVVVREIPSTEASDRELVMVTATAAATVRAPSGV
jgi:hypothetical protein